MRIIILYRPRGYFVCSLSFLSLSANISLCSGMKMTSGGTATSEDTIKKTVLCIFRRPVTFVTNSNKKIERKNLLDAVETSFADVLSCGEGTSNSKSYFLQTDDSEWGQIDLTGGVEDRATIYLCCSAGVSRSD